MKVDPNGSKPALHRSLGPNSPKYQSVLNTNHIAPKSLAEITVISIPKIRNLSCSPDSESQVPPNDSPVRQAS